MSRATPEKIVRLFLRGWSFDQLKRRYGYTQFECEWIVRTLTVPK